MDWEKEAQREYIVYPEGTYKLQVDSWEEVIASTGTPQIRWHLVIRMPEKYVGKKVTEHTPLTEKALWRLATFVKACGIDLSKLGKMETQTPVFYKVLDACKNRHLWVRLSVGVTPNGKQKNNFEDYQPEDDAKVEVKVDADDDVPAFLKEG
jgi:hypothetical protein